VERAKALVASLEKGGDFLARAKAAGFSTGEIPLFSRAEPPKESGALPGNVLLAALQTGGREDGRAGAAGHDRVRGEDAGAGSRRTRRAFVQAAGGAREANARGRSEPGLGGWSGRGERRPRVDLAAGLGRPPAPP